MNTDALYERDVPHDAAAEKSVIGSVLLDSRNALPQVRDWLKPQHFRSQSLRTIYEACCSLHDDGNAVDSVTVARLLQRLGQFEEINGAHTLMECMEAVPFAHHVDHYAKIVLDTFRRRQVVYRCREAIDKAHNCTTVEDIAALLSFDSFEEQTDEPFGGIDGVTLFESESSVKYLIDGLMVAGQPTILAGPQKSLKTNIIIDAAISLATGDPFLGKWTIPEPVKVGFMSGESGQATIRETAIRVAHSKGWSLREVEGITWCFELPTLNNPSSLRKFERWIEQKQFKVVFVDPIYLCLHIGNEAGNLFHVGEALRPVSDICAKTGCVIVLVHHTRKNRFEPFEPVELEDIAWAGFREWARQWILLNRREKYDPDNGGSHRLWISYGGSAGHSGVWGLDIEEGALQDDGGRRWDVEIISASQSRFQAMERREQDALDRQEAKKQQAIERDCAAVLEALRKFPAGETKREIRHAAILTNDRFNRALDALLQDGQVVPCSVTKANRATPYEGFKLPNVNQREQWENPMRKPVPIGPEGEIPTDHRENSDCSQRSDLSHISELFD